jgi:hypothetical protein
MPRAATARTAVSVGPITPSVARACLCAHDHAVPLGAPRRIATISARSTASERPRDAPASGAGGVQTP